MTSVLRRLLFCIVLFPVFSEAQTIYKSIGPDGVAIYSDKPPASGKIERTYEFVVLPSSLLSPESARKDDHRNGAGDSGLNASQLSGVVLYSTSWCGYCKKARAYLAQKNIPFRDIDVETPDGRKAYAQEGGRRGVPLLVSGSKRVEGFSITGYDSLFASR